MVYYEEVTIAQSNSLVLITRIMSSISFIPYLSLLIVNLFGSKQINSFGKINFQLYIASIIHSGSYLFPSMENAATTTPLCYIQSLFI